jgi:hypothetical protein
MKTLRVLATLLGMSTLLPPLARALEPVSGPVRDASGFVGWLASESVASAPVPGLPGATGRLLSGDAATGRGAWRVDFPAGYRADFEPGRFAQSIDVVVLEGELRFGAEALGPRDFAFVPPRGAVPRLEAPRGARALVFFDPPAPDAAAVERQRERGNYVTRYDPARWQPASVAKGAGLDIDLRIHHLKKDPFTTARTWYVRLGGGMAVPWERHSVVEEGYLMEGDYRLAECLPTRSMVGDYAAGGYFWRPGGIPHSGPESRTIHGATWLQRSPATLDVVFFHDCRDGAALDPVTKP